VTRPSDGESDPHAALLQAWARDMQRLLVHPLVRGPAVRTCTCGALAREGRPLSVGDSLRLAACVCDVKPLQAPGAPFMRLVAHFV
jgi:hypothetical protein